MKKLSLALLISSLCLTACGEDKAQAADESATTSTTAAVEATSTTAAEAKKETVAEAGKSGEAIHQENCTRCHASVVYTRDDRKVTSLDGLKTQVKMCDSQLETQLFPEDIDKVVSYLNETYYKF